MSEFGCPEHSKLVALIRRGTLGNDTRAHLDGCRECREVARVIRELAPLAVPAGDIPSFTNVYWRARAKDVLGTSSRRNSHVVRPLRILHFASGIGFVGAAVAIALGPLVFRTTFGAFAFVAPLLALAAAVAGGYQISLGNPRSGGESASV